ncbi:hypothetical protein Ocin01_16741 [Orchesella cincta]|uniref:Uncharacterized protein n=1 Tax=Orchesella cincta TaxID=48709 RepID=A0A1D2MAC4_ORCCI|nr:hypothetical protein Ocin01_16741 [Orchesella cincta]
MNQINSTSVASIDKLLLPQVRCLALSAIFSTKMDPSPDSFKPLQNGVKFFAIFDAVISALNAVLVVSILLVALFYNGEENPLNENKETVAVFSGIVIFIASHQLWMAVRLYNGAKLKESGKCMSWVGFTLVTIAIYIIGLLFSRSSVNFKDAILAAILMLIVYKVFGIAVVARFAARLRLSEQETTAFRFPFVVARRQQTCPTVRVSVIDLPPTYFDAQNPDTLQVDPPPYCEILVAKSRSDYTNSVGFVTT